MAKENLLWLSVFMVFFAFSFLVMENLPTYITDSSEYSILIWLIWAIGFSIGFIKLGFG